MRDTDWAAWHEPYDDPGAPLHQRLELVEQRIREALDRAQPGQVRVISVCAGQARDLLDVLPGHPRRDDVVARMVELDERNVAYARRVASAAHLHDVEVIQGDASLTSTYAGAVPADLVLVCGVFGNVTMDDVRNTIVNLPRLCKPGATVIWTRHRRPPDATPTIRGWFADEGFVEVAFDTRVGYLFGVGTARLTSAPLPFADDLRLFTFIGDGTGATV